MFKIIKARALFEVALLILTSIGCDDNKELQIANQKIQELELQNKELARENSLLEESEVGLFNKCQGAAEKTNGNVSIKMLSDVNEAIEYCSSFLTRYPQSNSVNIIKNIVNDKTALQGHLNTIIEVGRLANDGHLDEAQHLAESLRGKISEQFIENLISDIKNAKNRPLVISHQQLHKLASTGMEIGKKYMVYTVLMQDGRYLCSSLYDNACKDPDSLVRIEENFSNEKSQELYDLRGKRACFVVHMENDGYIFIDDFSPYCNKNE